MSATIHNHGIKNSNINVIPFKTINGVKYIRFDYCKHKHSKFIKINGVTYYDVSE